jgi:SAM-dependent methyltransferase
MFSQTARYYDEIYSFKDYREEAEKIAKRIRLAHSSARTVLDVACGTAEHAKFLSGEFSVDGVDLEPEFIEIAEKKVPSGSFSVGDMRSFSSDRRYDVVLCLFSSIGYLTNEADLTKALRCFASHLNSGGIIIVEPWITPENWKGDGSSMVTVDLPELKICRMNTSRREGKISHLDFHYLIAESDHIHHCEEHHELALYSVDEMLSFFKAAGLEVQYDKEGIFGRGLYTAMVSTSPE